MKMAKKTKKAAAKPGLVTMTKEEKTAVKNEVKALKASIKASMGATRELTKALAKQQKLLQSN